MPQEITTAKVATQKYDGAQTVTAVPTLAEDREIVIHTTGVVTESGNDGQLISGQKALKVQDHSIVALSTSTPLYRDLAIGDKGDDVRAFNDELSRLGYGAVQGSPLFTTRTIQAWKKLETAIGNTSDSVFHLSDMLWIPENTVKIKTWNASLGTTIESESSIATISGGITKITIKNGKADSVDRSIVIFGVTGTIPAGQTEINDADFCGRVAQTDDFKGLDKDSLAQGFDAQLSLKQSINVLRVPAGAVFGIHEENGHSVGCIVSLAGAKKAKTIHVVVVAGELGVSLIQPQSSNLDTVHNVRLGSSLNSARCV
ncbi:hypothetical protein ACFQY8_06355 [Alloscardovia venturai]|uniref:Uncharacterized protein n=1 Tax=Alloscardovia venturai TaxID=1769421 RepID=A0ABW2Y6I3_9BIFI